MVVKKRIPLSECALLSRVDARRYVGCLGDDRFDREVAPHCTPRMIGTQRFYRRSDLDAWVAGPHIEGPNPLLKAIHDAYSKGARCPP